MRVSCVLSPWQFLHALCGGLRSGVLVPWQAAQLSPSSACLPRMGIWGVGVCARVSVVRVSRRSVINHESSVFLLLGFNGWGDKRLSGVVSIFCLVRVNKWA